jgi:hypothetical protein
MGGRWRILVLGVVLALTIGACGGEADAPDDLAPEPDGVEEVPEEPDDEAEAEAPDDAEGPEEDAETPTVADGPTVSVYFVRSHESGIWVEPEAHQLEEPTEAVGRAAVTLLFTGTPHDASLGSAAPDDVTVLSVNLRDRVLIVDVSDDITAHGAGSAEELAFSQQLAHTGASFPTVDAVQLWVEGQPIEELWGHLDWSEPIEPDPFVVSPITITHPPAGPGEVSVAAGEITVRGTAMVFEATFGIRVYAPGGDLLVEDFVTASVGGPERGTWEYRVEFDEPGRYLIEVEEDDPSDGEGRPPFLLRREVEVR